MLSFSNLKKKITTRQNTLLQAIIYFLALQGRNTAWCGSGLLVYVFYVPSHMHYHLAAVSFGAYFSRHVFQLHNVFILLLSQHKNISIK